MEAQREPRRSSATPWQGGEAVLAAQIIAIRPQIEAAGMEQAMVTEAVMGEFQPLRPLRRRGGL